MINCNIYSFKGLNIVVEKFKLDMYKYTNKWMLFIRQNHQGRIINKISILHIYFACVIWDRQVNWCPLGCFSYNKMKQNETWFEIVSSPTFEKK